MVRKKKMEVAVRLLLEMLSIVIAVLLALGLEEWRENRKKMANVQAMLGHFHEEIKRNKSELNHSIESFQESIVEAKSAMAELKAFRGNKDAEFDELSYRYQFSKPGITDRTWQAALAGNVFVDMDVETIQVLADLYTLQDVVLSEHKKTWDILSDPRNTTVPLDFDENDRTQILRWLYYRQEIYERSSKMCLNLGVQLDEQYDKTLIWLEKKRSKRK